MKEPKVSDVKKYLSALLKIKARYVTADRLSKVVGIYPEIITETLSYFEPTLMMDPSFDLLDLVEPMKQFIIEKEEEKSQTLIAKAKPIKHKDLDQYESVGDFIYKKYTIAGGLLNKNAELSDDDLRILKKLISEEQTKRKKK